MRYPLNASARDVLDQLPWIAAVVRRTGPRVEYGNAHFQRLFGSSDDEVEAIVGKAVDHRGSLRECISRAFDRGLPNTLRRFPIGLPIDGDGRSSRVRQLDIHMHSIPSRRGAESAALLCAVDVTHRVTAARTLAGRERMHRQLLRAVATTHWESDATGQRVWEIGTQRTLPPIAAQATADPSGELTRAAWLEAVQSRSTFTSVHAMTATDGVHSLLTRAVPQMKPEGEIDRWVGIDIDVTELMNAAQAGGKAGDGAGVDLSLRFKALRGFSHDVRNVLHAADGYAQLLEEGHYGQLTGEQADSLHRMRSLFGNAMALITSMLETERARFTMARAERVPTEVNALVRDCVDGHRAQAEIARLVISVQSNLAEIWTATDPARIRQILDNLLSNALKFTRVGAIAVDVRMQDRGIGDARRAILVVVSDTGPGIERRDQDRIFQEFTRVGSDKVAGQGIGLAMSRILAHLVGGEITVDSEPGAGSSFTLWLPYEPVRDERIGNLLSSSGATEQPNQAAS